jgi:hypothetical protein
MVLKSHAQVSYVHDLPASPFTFGSKEPGEKRALGPKSCSIRLWLAGASEDEVEGMVEQFATEAVEPGATPIRLRLPPVAVE